ncbi:molybdopterin-binding protein, partial [Salarchaeum sp. III]|uniref:molybdopterin-binding protein n=1 Tax=Salarchaeum sp. III TaxID=3107927 RepID=UPI002EDADB5D
MEVALLTVGDELLAGETENTNASWLARQLTERGATATRVLVVPDDHDAIAAYTRKWRERFDAVIVTGGLGGTPDDVTMDAVADAVGRDVVVSD